MEFPEFKSPRQVPFAHPWLVFGDLQPHLTRMTRNIQNSSPRACRPLLVGFAMLSLLALGACANTGTADGGKTHLQAPGFDSQIGGA